MSKKMTDYWLKYYVSSHCTLCGNWGIIDTRSVMTPAGLRVGRLNYCICPNGQALRKGNVPLEQLAREAGYTA